MDSIAIFLPSLDGGGAEKMMLNISSELDERGYDVDLVVSNLEGEFVNLVSESVHLVDFDAPSFPGYSMLGSLPSLVKYLRSKEPDTFLSVLNRANVVAILAHKISQIDGRLVVSERNNLSKFTQNTNRRNRVLPYLIRFTYPKADAVTAISTGVADEISEVTRLSRTDIEVTYNPAYSPDIDEKAEENVNHQWLNNNCEIVLGVGSLTTQKDFSTLIKSFAKVRDHRDTKLIILGKGDKKSKLKKLITKLDLEDHVDMPGFVSNPYAYMNKSDAFVLSSRWEGFGNVVVEAMACGTPVVSTNCPSGPGEILQHGKYGELTPIGDPKEISSSIRKVLENPPDSALLTNRAKDFSVESITDNYENVLIKNDK